MGDGPAAPQQAAYSSWRGMQDGAGSSDWSRPHRALPGRWFGPNELTVVNCLLGVPQ